MAVPLPRSTRIAGSGYHHAVGPAVLGLGLVGFAGLWLPKFGPEVLFACIALSFVAANRRRTMGAYESDAGLVVRNYLRTQTIPWPQAVKVTSVRDPNFPWGHVAAVVLTDGTNVRVTALRYLGEPTDAVLLLTRVVRERREASRREPWLDG